MRKVSVVLAILHIIVILVTCRTCGIPGKTFYGVKAMKTSCVLLAEQESLIGRVKESLYDYPVLEATGMKQAVQLMLEYKICIFVVGLHFDDTGATELIKMVRLNPHYDNVPIVVQRLLPLNHASFIRTIMQAMKRVHTIDEYLDLEGDRQARLKLQVAVKRNLAARLTALQAVLR